MNLRPAHLPQKPASRTIGLAFVAAVHVAAFIAFSQGLTMPKDFFVPKEPATVRPIDEPPPPARPIEKIKVDQPKTAPIDTPVIQPPDVPISATPPTGGIVVERGDPLPDFSARGPVAPPVQAQPNEGIRSAGAVCTRTQSPEAPAVNWTGEALFSVVAGTHAGRVNQVEIRLLRGSMDGRTQRAFRSAIESAMREGYQCPGDVRFSQEFQFRVAE